jgi:nitrile hydratase
MTFAVGDRVRVADRAHAGHHRTPGYVKGRRGRIERVHGSFTNPETRAYGSDGLPEVVLYQVAFELEPARTYVDVYEHWLEEAR